MKSFIRIIQSVGILFIIFISSASWAVQATGVGINRDHALNAAFQAAIESVLGVAMHSESVAENFVLVKDEIVTHSRGYVTGYQILYEKKELDGSVSITIEAEVNKDLLIDHAQTLDILMKMAGHPRVIIFGIDDDLDSVPAGTESFEPLVHAVSEVFSQKFRFEVLDWPTLRNRHNEIQGKPDRAKIIKYNDKLKADYMVTVKLNLLRNKKAKLVMSSVRISDNYILGKIEKQIQKTIFPPKPPALYRSAVEAAKEDVFMSSVSLARIMIEKMQAELDRGKGFRYVITLLKFPEVKKVENELASLSGYVRHVVKRANKTNMELSYWSNLKSDALLEQVKSALYKMNYKYKYKMNGRTLQFKWEHSEGF